MRVGVAGGKNDFLPVGRKIAAGGASPAGADPPRCLLIQLLHINLIERITDRICLIDNILSVRREVSFTGSGQTERHLPQASQVFRLLLIHVSIFGENGLSSEKQQNSKKRQ